MDRFTNAARSAVETKNWYGALSISLTLPDICGRLENPKAATQARYRDWWDKYALKKYQANVDIDGERETFLSGDDAYALRCAYLHEGGADITLQKARQTLDRFHFVAPKEGWLVHCNAFNDVLQLQPDIFCLDVCNGVDEWMIEHAKNPLVSSRLGALIVIGEIADLGFF